MPTLKVSSHGEADRQTVRHRMAVHDLAVHLQGAGATIAQARAVVLPVEHERVLAGCQRLLALPLHALQLDQVPGEDRPALQQVEAVAGEAAAVGDQHALGAALGNVDLGRDRVRPVQHVRRAARTRERHVGQLARIGEHGPAGGVARLRADEPGEGAVVEREDLVFRRLHGEQLLHVAQLVRHLGREVVGLRPVLVEVVELPLGSRS